MNTKESRGRITDADFALESANLTKSNSTTINYCNDSSSKQINANSSRPFKII